MRTLYLWFLLAFAIMAYGFWPSVRGDFGQLDPLHWLHGLLAAAWMALLVAQSWLIGHGKWALHRRFGRASRYLVPLLVLSSLTMVQHMLAAPSPLSRDLRLTLAWADLLSLLLFSALYVAAIAYRRRFALHARLMAATVFVMLPPALGRAYGPLFGGLRASLDPAYLTVEAALVALILWDARFRRFPPPFPLALAGIVVLHLTMFHAAAMAPFVGLAMRAGLPRA